MSSLHFKNQSSRCTHTQRGRLSALRIKKAGPKPTPPAVVFFSPFLLSSVSLASRLVGKNKQRFCSRTPEKRKNSRRATRKTVVKKELCNVESVFFFLPDECFAILRISGLLRERKKIGHTLTTTTTTTIIIIITPPPNLTPVQQGIRTVSPPSQPTAACFLTVGL